METLTLYEARFTPRFMMVYNEKLRQSIKLLNILHFLISFIYISLFDLNVCDGAAIIVVILSSKFPEFEQFNRKYFSPPQKFEKQGKFF